MDTFWLKAGAIIIVIIGAVVGAVMLMPSEKKEKPQQKTIYDMAEKDKKELLAEPNADDFNKNKESSQTSEVASDSEQKNTETTSEVTEEEKSSEPTVLYFTEVSEIDKIEAENILQNIPSWRTMGRLPVTGYGAMVESCRQLMRRFPGSIYDYKARRALAEVPQRYWGRYEITAEEIDLDYFKTQRPGTEPYKLTEDD